AWIVNAYLIAYTLVIPLLGRVSDHRGRHAVFMWCLALFAFGSIVAGLANTLSWMIVGRAVQALGAGGMVPVVMAYVGDVLPVERRPLALGIVGAVDTAGWVIGPLYGALMVVLANWRLIFFINLPLSLAIGLGMLASRDANATRAERASMPARSALDWPGALSLTVAVAALTLALTGGQTAESTSPFAAQGGLNPLAGPLAFFFVIGLVAFVWAERHSAQPLIPLSLFAERTVTAACIANLLVGAALILVMVDVPIFVNVAVAPTLADAPVLSGAALALFTLGMVGGALAGGWLASVRGYRLAALLGLLLAASGFWLMAQWRVESVLDVMWPGLMLTGLGFGTVIAPLASAVINSAGEEQRGIASALVLVQRLIGMALGLALLTTLGLLRFNSLAQALPPINSGACSRSRQFRSQCR
ncbi:MAG: MFS transporter, partial [Chloroflexi bacterium]